jgi:hypothetical protein
MQWVQIPNKSNVGNLKKLTHQASRHLRNKKKACLNAKLEELETNCRIKNIRDLYRGMNDLVKDYQPRTNIVKNVKGDLVADSQSILARWRNYYSQPLNVHGVNDVKYTEMHTAEPLVPDPTAFESEMAVEQLTTYKLPGIDQIPAEVFAVGGRTICSEIHKLTNSI